MAVRKRQIGSIVVLDLSGRFYGGEETDVLGKAIQEAIAEGNTRLILNLSECEYLNSTALGVVSAAEVDYERRNGAVKIYGLGKRLQAIFVTTKLIMRFGHHESESEAIAAFAEEKV